MAGIPERANTTSGSPSYCGGSVWLTEVDANQAILRRESTHSGTAIDHPAFCDETTAVSTAAGQEVEPVMCRHDSLRGISQDRLGCNPA